LFLDDWQFSLLAGEDGAEEAEDVARCRERIATVTGIPV
jgi:hypothetical protein